MGLNKLLDQRHRERGGVRRARKQARRRTRDRTAGDNPSGRAGYDRLKASMPTSACGGQALGDDRLKNAEGTDPGKAAPETAKVRPHGQRRSAAVRRLGFPRWDV